ncbi:hypothetical protein LOK49_LG14G00822 [Camellia lanceoleosa]|uniref:Uncharacterized protein n=1 Tax=Camellia lanceoleosa TaxID=1840588 RepID=A0ACC0FAH0_9ERIC|nr:hypothetical protein LOK49_LG14G00822 [Camellia lanceoleosa]
MVRRFQEEDASLIMNTLLPVSDVVDKLVWHYTDSGDYTVGSGYETAMMLKRNGLLGRCGEGDSSGRGGAKVLLEVIVACSSARHVPVPSKVTLSMEMLQRNSPY